MRAVVCANCDSCARVRVRVRAASPLVDEDGKYNGEVIDVEGSLTDALW